MNELIMELEAAVNEMWTCKPADIDRMLERKGACGSGFTIVSFVKMETQGAANYLYMLYLMAMNKEGELETLKTILINYLMYLGDRFTDYYKMETSYSLSMRSAIEAANIKTHEDYSLLVRAVQRYFGQLSYWVDFSIPWKDMSKKYDEMIRIGRNSL